VARAPIKMVSTRNPPRKIVILPIRASYIMSSLCAVIVSLQLSALQRQIVRENTDQILETKKPRPTCVGRGLLLHQSLFTDQ
jgi:hypothetical protein